MAPPRQSICWKLVTLRADMKTAVCDICNAELVYCKRGNTNLLRHLRTKHPFELAQYEELARPKSKVAVQPSTELRAVPPRAATSSAPSSEDIAVLADVNATVSASSSSTEHSSKQLTLQATIH